MVPDEFAGGDPGEVGEVEVVSDVGLRDGRPPAPVPQRLAPARGRACDRDQVLSEQGGRGGLDPLPPGEGGVLSDPTPAKPPLT